jgi:hypothetical protein
MGARGVVFAVCVRARVCAPQKKDARCEQKIYLPAPAPLPHHDPKKVDAFMFGSVPLRTYLPDGDIDVSVFCGPEAAAALRDVWAPRVQAALLAEARRGTAPYEIGDVTVINAEVRVCRVSVAW